jgi:hypothetical protein
MRYVALVLVLGSLAAAESTPACVIIRHASTARQFFVSGANWQYVEGDFPADMKWKSNVTDRTVRKVKQLGGKVVTVPNAYSPADLEDARKQCKEK